MNLTHTDTLSLEYTFSPHHPWIQSTTDPTAKTTEGGTGAAAATTGRVNTRVMRPPALSATEVWGLLRVTQWEPMGTFYEYSALELTT